MGSINGGIDIGTSSSHNTGGRWRDARSAVSTKCIKTCLDPSTCSVLK